MSLASHLTKSMKEHSAKHKKAEPSKKKKVRSIEVEPAKGGYSVSTRYHGDDMDHYTEPEKSVHKSLSSVAKHMKEVCGGDEGDENEGM
jgi:hypothetical protein